MEGEDVSHSRWAPQPLSGSNNRVPRRGILPMHAQNFPSGNITIVVPAAPGGGHDAVARVIGQKLRARLGWTIIMENRGGANGMIAAEAVAKSRPDGRTILVSTPANNYVGPELRKDMRFNPARDLAQVTLAGVTPIVFVAHPSEKASTFAEMIELARTSPGSVSYATTTELGAQALSGALIAKLAGITMTAVPYKGAGPATMDVLSGQVPFGIVGMAPVLPQIRAGKLKALAVMNKARVRWLPDVPAVAESPGMSEFEMLHWMGVQVQAQTSPDIIRRLNVGIVETLRAMDVQDALLAQGIEPVGNTPEQFGAFVEAERRKAIDVILRTHRQLLSRHLDPQDRPHRPLSTISISVTALADERLHPRPYRASDLVQWHEAAVRRCKNHVRFLRYSGRERLAVRLSHFDQTGTSAVLADWQELSQAISLSEGK
jgi:tripartite-type tricarboxylate transporter receptor subunit TctC